MRQCPHNPGLQAEHLWFLFLVVRPFSISSCMHRPTKRRRRWPRKSSPFCLAALVLGQSDALVPTAHGPSSAAEALRGQYTSCAAWFSDTREGMRALLPSRYRHRTRRRSSCNVTRLTRQQMIDMGLVPPEENRQQHQQTNQLPLPSADEVDGEDGCCGGDSAAEESGEPVGLIGHFEAMRLMGQKGKLGSFVGSLDMSLTERDLVSTEEGVALPPAAGGVEPCLVVSWDELAVVLKKAKKGQYGCWELYADGNSPSKVSDISESTGRPAMLCAPLRSAGPPTMVLGGFAMHRISGGDQKSTMEPGLDTERKVSASGARRSNGRVLDTCTGLGYTAIAAARCKGVTGVVTVELDEVSLRMCSRNPWSREMFDNPKITSLHGDCCEIVKGFKDGEFAAIIHDPPARALCKTTDMYGAKFYEDLARVLKPGGTLFHYIGNPESKEGGRLFRGVIDRLIGAGFYECKTDKNAFGVVARR